MINFSQPCHSTNQSITPPIFLCLSLYKSLNASLFHKLGVGVPLEGTFYNKDRRVVPRSEISAAIKECVSSNLFKTAQQFKQICIKASQRAAQQEHF